MTMLALVYIVIGQVNAVLLLQNNKGLPHSDDTQIKLSNALTLFDTQPGPLGRLLTVYLLHITQSVSQTSYCVHSKCVINTASMKFFLER